MKPLSVTDLNEALNQLMTLHFSSVSVQGELAQLQVPSSGHAYLTLRDDRSSLSAVCWRTNWRSQSYRPKVGEQVVCRGKLAVYSPQGRYQLYVSHVEPAGEGAWAQELAARKARLEAEGLLDPRRKRPLPAFPKVVGVATSLTGAALQDFLKVSRARYPAARVLVAGCTVQGREAAADILRAVELLVEDGRSELIVVTRGGGSKSDLVAFQDEQLARFLAQVPVPVLSAVGHQIDTCLCDLVADVVAATPSDAALKAFPDGETLSQQVDDWAFTLETTMGRLIAQRRAALEAVQSRLKHPGQKFVAMRARSSELEERLRHAMRRQLQGHQNHSSVVSGRLIPATSWYLERRGQRLSSLEGRLQALSPFSVLERGYAIVSRRDSVVTDPNQLEVGEELGVRVHKGEFTVSVTSNNATD